LIRCPPPTTSTANPITKAAITIAIPTHGAIATHARGRATRCLRWRNRSSARSARRPTNAGWLASVADHFRGRAARPRAVGIGPFHARAIGGLDRADRGDGNSGALVHRIRDVPHYKL
jgi:hypothetical protein